MRFQNDGKSESNVIQNRFTAYVVRAIRRRKCAVINKRKVVSQFEFSAELQNDFAWMQAPEKEFTEFEIRCEIAAFERALEHLDQRERYIIVSRLLQNRAFRELAQELGIGYKGVTSVYYRAIRKIREEMGDDG